LYIDPGPPLWGVWHTRFIHETRRTGVPFVDLGPPHRGSGTPNLYMKHGVRSLNWGCLLSIWDPPLGGVWHTRFIHETRRTGVPFLMFLVCFSCFGCVFRVLGVFLMILVSKNVFFDQNRLPNTNKWRFHSFFVFFHHFVRLWSENTIPSGVKQY